MKTLILLAAFTAGFTHTAIAAGGLAAKDALRTLGRERGPSWLGRIVQLSGDRGMDQPDAWHIVASDGQGGLREFFVGPKGIISEGPVPAAVVPSVQGPVIGQKKFEVDSTIAFTKAEKVAKKARIGFDSATYRLRSPGPDAPAVWTLQFQNSLGQKVADVTVSASTGKVAQFVAYNPAPPAPPAPPASQTQQAVQRTREVVTRSTASVGRGISRAGGWIREKFGTTEQAQAQAPEYYVPSPER